MDSRWVITSRNKRVPDSGTGGTVRHNLHSHPMYEYLNYKINVIGFELSQPFDSLETL